MNSSSDLFYTVNILDSRIDHIKSEIPYGVLNGAGQNTFQQFPCPNPSASSIIYNLQIPSQSTLVDRGFLQQATFCLTINCANVPVGNLAFNYGMTDSLQAFPLNSLIVTQTATINNATVTSNIQDILPMMMRMYDNETLIRYNSTSPCLPDIFYQKYANAVGTMSNPLSSYNNMSYNMDLIPRGSYPVKILQVQHFVAGVYADNSLISTATTDTWTIILQATVTEPILCMSPFCNRYTNDEACFLGLNNLTITLNIDATCKRVFSSATGYITSISLGGNIGAYGGMTASTVPAFQNCSILLNLLSLQPEHYEKLSARNVLPYLDLPRYIFSATETINPQSSASIAVSNYQLNQIPDLFIICARLPTSLQNWNWSSSYLTINSITINFNNKSGILASATQQQLYHLSQKNGSSQSYFEFLGNALVNNNASGQPSSIPTTGSLLVLNPSLDFGLESFYSAGSLGQYSMQFTLNITNQTSQAITPEIVLLCVNSGLFITENGVSVTQTGILTKQVVLDTKTKTAHDTVDSTLYHRIIGGNLMNIKQLGHIFKKKIMGKSTPEEADINGAEKTGASMCAGSESAGKMRLHRFTHKKK